MIKKSNSQLLQYLASVLRKKGDISWRQFDILKDKPRSAMGYKRRFESWNRAKKFAHRFNVSGESEEENSSAYECDLLEKKVKDLQRELSALKKERLTEEEIRIHLFELKESKLEVPDWTLKPHHKEGVKGIPCLQLSDWHGGEVVKSDQVFGRNAFNLGICKKRVHSLARNTLRVLHEVLFRKIAYPGLVLLLNGDFISGTIHDELTITNDKPIMPSVLEVLSMLIWFINQMADSFQRVMIFATPGNHGRTTKKLPMKDKAYTSYDWLMYQLLEKWFENDKRINFAISNGEDIQFRIYNHRYRMTHGDQFRGGTGFIGPYAPITRGEIKKRSAAETYGMNYDTLVIGHFHQMMSLNRVIVNGSLIGYNEFAMHHNFPYETPCQALWITHPKYGITIRLPVFCESIKKSTTADDWVSWKV